MRKVKEPARRGVIPPRKIRKVVAIVCARDSKAGKVAKGEDVSQ
jgi:hypothetical protein